MAQARYRFAEHDRSQVLTDTVIEWLPVFTRPQTARVLLDSWIWLQANVGLDLGAQSAQDRRGTAGAVSGGNPMQHMGEKGES